MNKSNSQWGFVYKSVEKNYLEYCKNAVLYEDIFINFRKKNKSYSVILEGSSIYDGYAYIRKFKKLNGFKWLINNINKIKKNDLVGNPNKHFYKDINVNISPSTLKYALDAYIFMSEFNLQNKKKIKILEVGGGYGGLARILGEFLNIEQYALIDQKEPIQLTKKYLDNQLFKVNKNFKYKFIDSNDISNEDFSNYDFFIGCSSLAELNLKIQNFYFTQIIKYFSGAYIIYNTTHYKENLLYLDNLCLKLKKSNINYYIFNPWFGDIYLFIDKENNFLNKKSNNLPSTLLKKNLIIKIIKYILFKFFKYY